MPQDREWAEFLDRLIHDVREPLRSVHAFSELLRETAAERIGPDGETAVGEIVSGAARMRTLVDGISGYALALREADAAPGQHCSMQLAFELVSDSLAKQIQACGASVSAEGLPRVGMGLERAMQLLENVIGNSLKFRSEAAPEIRLTATAEADGWNVAVEDNGIGVDGEESQRFFLPFSRVHGRKYPGAGLGLATCRRIVEAHGGWISLTSREGGGAVCRFWLPEA